MQFNIDVISVSPVATIPTKGGKSYQMVEIAYKKDGKIEGKKIMSFSNPAVFRAVQEYSSGDSVTVTADKGEPNASGQSFWNWVAVASTEDITTAPTASGSSAAPAAKTVSNYETREERQAKQVYIVRQSSISNALTYFDKTQGGKKTGVSDVLAVAKQFENYVFDTTQTAAHAGDLSELEDDIPL